MKIHEYQAKELLKKFDIPVPEGRLCTSAAEAAKAYDALESPICVVKAQIHAGGRGKGGGVKLVKSREECEKVAGEILGMQLITHQTGPEGQKVRRVWVEKGSDIKSEFYLGAAIDRESKLPVLMACIDGGMDIEEVAAKTPEKIIKVTWDPAVGLKSQEALKLARAYKLKPGLEPRTGAFMMNLAKAFVELDCELAEINPLILTADGELMALDAKMNFDSNALFRHPDVVELRDLDEEDPKEIEAAKFDLSYIALDGNIGCMVNGAGLAMATMDVIKLNGQEPANFLDVGGGATKENVKAAFRILLSDPNVKAVLVNIFGGIMKCDIIAEGIVAAVKEIELNVPLVVRLEGTNVKAGKKILEDSGLPLIAAEDLDDAAIKICEQVA